MLIFRRLTLLTHKQKPPTLLPATVCNEGVFVCLERAAQTYSPYQLTITRSTKGSIYARCPHVTSRGMSTERKQMKCKKHTLAEQVGTSAMPHGLSNVARSLALPAILPAKTGDRNSNSRTHGSVEFGIARCVSGGAR